MKIPAMLAMAAMVSTGFLVARGSASADTKQTDGPKPKVEVVFVLDSTGSMGGLIEGAKQKIWSIANGIVARKPTPEVRFGLVAYRDRGDEYVTKVFDLTDDLDTVFKNLQSFKAGGGGDGPESVNQALSEAVRKISWSPDKKTLKTIFLVGDFPPHMDYKEDVKYPETCQEAAKRDIVINTVQCGSERTTTPVWQEIARLAEGTYVALEQSGGMNAVATPFDSEVANLSKEMGKTAIVYGSASSQRVAKEKVASAAAAPESVSADRAYFNFKSGGKAIQGKGDMVSDMKDGSVDIAKISEAELPEEMKGMDAAGRKAYVEKQAGLRAELNAKLEGVLRQRADFIEAEKKRLEASGKGDAFDLKVNEMINSQAEKMNR